MPIRTAALAALVLSAPAAVLAEEPRHADAHEHGVSHLQIAVDGPVAEAELRAPGADIVGFEHAASSDADKAAVEAVLTALRDPARLFGLKGCAATEIEAHLDREGDEEHHGHDEHEHDEHDAHAEDDHDHDHDKKKHADHDAHEDERHGAHDHDAHDHEDEDGGHSEFHAIYALACGAPVTALDLSGFFAAFPNAAEVEIQAVTDHGAQAHEATRAAPTVALD